MYNIKSNNIFKKNDLEYNNVIENFLGSNQTFESLTGSIDNLSLTFNNSQDGWNQLYIRPTSLWGDGLTTPNETSGDKFLTIKDIMLQNPHVVPKKPGEIASIRLGRAYGIKTGNFWEIGTKPDGNFHIAMNGNTPTTGGGDGIIFNSANKYTELSGEVRFNRKEGEPTQFNSNTDGNNYINGQLFVNGSKINKTIFSFTPIITGSNIYNIDLNARGINSITGSNNVRILSLHAWSTSGDFGGNWIYSGSYIFYISGFDTGKFRKQVLHESGAGGTFNYLNPNTIQFTCTNSAAFLITVVIEQLY